MDDDLTHYMKACGRLRDENKAKAKQIKELEEALNLIWPFIKEDFPNGTGANHGTCATVNYVLAARKIEQALKG